MRTSFNMLFVAVFALCCIPSARAQTIPANTPIPIKLDQTISSKKATVNQRVKGKIAQDVVIDGDIVLPKDAKAELFVEKVQPGGGDSAKPASLWLRLDAIAVNGRAYPVSALIVGQQLTLNSANADAPVSEFVKNVSENKGSALVDGDPETNAGPPQIKFAPATILSFRLTSPLHMQ